MIETGCPQKHLCRGGQLGSAEEVDWLVELKSSIEHLTHICHLGRVEVHGLIELGCVAEHSMHVSDRISVEKDRLIEPRSLLKH